MLLLGRVSVCWNQQDRAGGVSHQQGHPRVRTGRNPWDGLTPPFTDGDTEAQAGRVTCPGHMDSQDAICTWAHS